METIKYLEDLILDYGRRFYGPEGPEYAAKRWVEALPNADLPDFHEWFYRGFWSPDVARALSNAGIYPWEVTSSTAHDLCCGDLPISRFLQIR